MTIASILHRSPSRPDAFPAVIADAKRRQRRRRITITLTCAAVLLGGLAWKELIAGAGETSDSVAAATQTPTIPNPCSLLSDGVVSRTSRITIAYSVPSFHQCSWSGLPFKRQYGQRQIAVSLALMTKSQFVESVGGTWHRGAHVLDPARPIADLGDGAFWLSVVNELAVYHNGIAISIRGVLLRTPLASEKALAGEIITRLDRRRHA